MKKENKHIIRENGKGKSLREPQNYKVVNKWQENGSWDYII